MLSEKRIDFTMTCVFIIFFFFCARVQKYLALTDFPQSIDYTFYPVQVVEACSGKYYPQSPLPTRNKGKWSEKVINVNTDCM